MKEFCSLALEILVGNGATYGDIRIIDEQTEDISVQNGMPSIDENSSLGFGVRCIVDGSWGFAASSKVTRDEIERVAKLSVQVAKASAQMKTEDIHFAPEGVYRDKWLSTYIIDPFAVPLEKKLALLMECDKILRENNQIVVANTFLSFWREHQFFASTEGSEIEQIFTRSGGGISATAVDQQTGEIQTRSYPGVHAGQFMQGGWEIVEAYDYIGNAPRIRDEAVALLTAMPCPNETMDIIIGGEQLALQIHESLGHPSELDRVLGMEANYAGTSFLTPEKLGNFKYGSELVTIVADATAPGGLATLGYDDDGVRAQRWNMVKNGIFTGYLTNRELAHVVGEERSRGANRAEGFYNLPMVRMTNISLLPGTDKLEDMIAGIDRGMFINTNKSWSIDQKRLNFQFTTEIGWMIENGKLGAMVKNPTYQSITPQFWGSCDAIADASHWHLWGVNNCGKGQPGQRAEMSHGAAPTRFRKIKVGLG